MDEQLEFSFEQFDLTIEQLDLSSEQLERKFGGFQIFKGKARTAFSAPASFRKNFYDKIF